MAICKKHDCIYYSTYTRTCDYTLVMFRARSSPVSACTEYAPRAERRTWMRFIQKPGDVTPEEETENMKTPEPPVLPPEDTRYIIADCLHEVYEGERLYDWEDGATLCPECMEDKFSELSTREKAALLGCESSVVSFRGLNREGD
jgi:hypothetical protein